MTIQPKGYAEIDEEFLKHPAIQRHLRNGALQIKPDSDIHLSPGERFMRDIDPGGDVVLQRSVAHGDVLLCSAPIRSLKKKYPNLTIHIDTSTESLALLKRNPNVVATTGIKEMHDKVRKYGHFLSLNNIPEAYEDAHKPAVTRNRIEILCDYLGIECDVACPEYYISESHLQFARDFVEKYPRPYIGVGPVSRRREKMWPMDRWQHLVSLVKGTVFVFHPRKMLEGRNVVSMEFYDLQLSAAIGSQMDCFVTLDSLWTHMAAALGIPQVLLASCTDGELLSKEYPSCHVLHGEEACYPCWYSFSAGGCSLGQHPRCMEGITPGDVYEAVEGRLDAA